MQQHQQQQGGPQYGVPPEISQPFTGAGAVQVHVMGIPGTDATALAEAASPISSRPPPTARGSFDELAPGTSGFQDDDTGEEAERGPPGNRWPRQETLALLKIRSEMDAVFRDATLKGPLWEDVSRKLADLGYTRSAKKCKEKFENVHKYYKRTKEGRAGRQDGRSYRFFSQLEALNSGSSTNTTTAAAPAPVAVNPPYVSASSGLGASNLMAGSSGRPAPPTPPAPVSANLAAAAATTQTNVVPPIGPVLAGPGPGPSTAAAAAGISFSTSSSSESESEDEIEEGGSKDSRKRKRSGSSGGGGGSKKMMAFFEVLMKHVMEKQEAMQQRFLETLEKREHERMMREESWKRQEMARLAREQEIMAQERAMSASRDATVIAFLQKITGQTVPIPSPAIIIPTAAPPPPPQSNPQPQPQLRPSPSPSPSPQQQQQRHQHQPRPQPPPAPPPHQSQSTEIVSSSEVVVTQEEPLQHQEMAGSGSFESASSRWPKTEVLALINLRSGLDSRYQETGPKGPLWEEISAGMQRLGYNRSSKRCKEKWENINKYFKKVKESNKKRPEDAKTCPYFHQLDALYRKKALGGGSSSSLNTQSKQEQDTDANPNPQERTDVLAIMPPPPSQQQQQHSEIKSSNSNKNGGNPDTGGGGSLQIQTSNGGLPPTFFEGTAKKPEDIVKELMDDHHQLPRHHHQQPQSVMNGYNKLEELDSDHLDQEEDDYDDEDDDEDEEDGKTAYKIEFQQQNAGPPKGERNVAPAPPGSVLAMVQ